MRYALFITGSGLVFGGPVGEMLMVCMSVIDGDGEGDIPW